jgi:hypothetical protein
MIPTACTVLSAAILAAEAGDGDYGKYLAGGSAAALVAGLFVFVTKHTTASHEKVSQQFSETVDKSNQRFSATIEKQAEVFGATTTTLVREGRESSERREQALQDLLRNVNKAS